MRELFMFILGVLAHLLLWYATRGLGASEIATYKNIIKRLPTERKEKYTPKGHYRQKTSYQIRKMILAGAAIYPLVNFFWTSTASIIIGALFFGIVYYWLMMHSDDLSILSFTINLGTFLGLFLIAIFGNPNVYVVAWYVFLFLIAIKNYLEFNKEVEQ